MKKLLITLFAFIIICSFSRTASAQDPSEQVFQCSQKAGPDAKYVKDYIVRLPEANSQNDIPTHKNTAILSEHSSRCKRWGNHRKQDVITSLFSKLFPIFQQNLAYDRARIKPEAPVTKTCF